MGLIKEKGPTEVRRIETDTGVRYSSVDGLDNSVCAHGKKLNRPCGECKKMATGIWLA